MKTIETLENYSKLIIATCLRQPLENSRPHYRHVNPLLNVLAFVGTFIDYPNPNASEDHGITNLNYPGLNSAFVDNPMQKAPEHLAEQFIQELSVVYKAVAKDLPENVKLNFVSVICYAINCESSGRAKKVVDESLQEHFKEELNEFTTKYLMPYMYGQSHEKKITTLIAEAGNLDTDSREDINLSDEDVVLLILLFESLNERARRKPESEQAIFNPGAVEQSFAESLQRSLDPATLDGSTPNPRGSSASI